VNEKSKVSAWLGADASMAETAVTANKTVFIAFPQGLPCEVRTSFRPPVA
jgi:hypothetical protein